MSSGPRPVTLDDLTTRPDDAPPPVLRVDGARLLLADRSTHEQLLEVVDLPHGLAAIYVSRDNSTAPPPLHVAALDDPGEA